MNVFIYVGLCHFGAPQGSCLASVCLLERQRSRFTVSDLRLGLAMDTVEAKAEAESPSRVSINVLLPSGRSETVTLPSTSKCLVNR